MNIIVIGAGEIGRTLCSVFSKDGHNIYLIEKSKEVLNAIDEELDIKTLNGNGCFADDLIRANVQECDYFFAMTNDDKTNIISSSIAKSLGAKNTISSVKDEIFLDNTHLNYQVQFEIDYLVSPFVLCAVEIAKKIRNPGSVVVEHFAKGAIEVQTISLSDESKYANRSLKDLNLPTNLRIGYIQRGQELEIPTKDTSLKANDLITLVGPSDVIFDYKMKFNPSFCQQKPNVVIFGGNYTGKILLNLLNRFNLRVIEENFEICKEIAEKFPNVSVIHGQATSMKLLEEEQINCVDYFVACSRSDEENIMACLQAKRLGAKNVFLVINQIDYYEMLNEMKQFLKIDLIISPRMVISNEMRNYISQELSLSLGNLGKCGEIVQLRISPKSPCSGKRLMDIPWPGGSIMVALSHKYQVKLPCATDMLIGGDRVIFIAKRENISQLTDLLCF